jgi:hypothetical protein
MFGCSASPSSWLSFTCNGARQCLPPSNDPRMNSLVGPLVVAFSYTA